MIKWAPSRAGLSIFFLVLALVVLIFDRQTYKHYSGAEVKVVARRSLNEATVQTTIKELTSKLAKPKVKVSRYSVTEDKNLFSASRTAWHPPAPKPPPDKKNEASKAPAAVPARRDVVLYGTYIAGDTKKALLHFKRFRKGKLLVAEGEKVKDADSGSTRRRNSPSYQVVKVEPRQVVLKDGRGTEFTVNLYDNKQHRPVKTVNKKSIEIDKTVPVKKVVYNASAPPGAPASRSGGGGTSSGSGLTSRQIRKLSREEKDALVKKGVLQKHNTPFGPIYQRSKSSKK